MRYGAREARVRVAIRRSPDLLVSDLAHIPQASYRHSGKSSWGENAAWSVVLLSSAAIAVYGTTYFIKIPGDPHFARYILLLRLHIGGGIVALLAGPWQFSGRLRARALSVHRWLGRFYLLAVALGSVAGFAMATVSNGGPPTHTGFAILAVLWFYTGACAYRAVRRGEISLHRQWMMRNFALTLAAVTLRIELPFMLAALHWPFHRAFMIVAWLCWIPNLTIAEFLVRSEGPGQLVR